MAFGILAFADAAAVSRCQIVASSFSGPRVSSRLALTPCAASHNPIAVGPALRRGLASLLAFALRVSRLLLLACVALLTADTLALLEERVQDATA